ncbi:glycosyltransferase family 4 protein [uncultured Winogradskyella sp.]|uniref:glycosyltransferase family 4 protein n=1 Tax=uncultured Winogradskyella sp. TaxID=395353 RepID=UPI00261BF116|nr:glycosyltransferase family 4 protein [uncultured Winogradskyella sp.]
MKILQINKYLKIVGGAETYMFQLSKALKELNVEVKFWGMEDSENIVNDFLGLEAKNVDYKNLSILNKATSVINTIYSKDNRQKLAKVLDKYQPDIVHIHNYNFQLTPSILPEIKKRGIKVVQTIHDSQMVCPYHRLYNFQRDQTCTKCVKGSFVNCIKDKCFDGSLFKSAVGAFESAFYHKRGFYDKYVDVYISPSEFLANLVRERIDKKIIVIPNFTEVKTDLDLDIEKEEFYLYYGRISEEKGIIDFLDHFVKTNLKLLIIGKGSLEESVINKTKDNDNIRYLGPKYGRDLFNIVKKAKYVIQPSKGFENCPMTVIESFALGVPVIGSNHSGFMDLIQNGETGYLLDFSDMESALKHLLKIDKKPTKHLKKNIDEYFKDNLSRQVHMNKIMSVYNKLTTS